MAASRSASLDLAVAPPGRRLRTGLGNPARKPASRGLRRERFGDSQRKIEREFSRAKRTLLRSSAAFRIASTAA
jgi:hypothetical protein